MTMRVLCYVSGYCDEFCSKTIQKTVLLQVMYTLSVQKQEKTVLFYLLFENWYQLCYFKYFAL